MGLMKLLSKTCFILLFVAPRMLQGNQDEVRFEGKYTLQTLVDADATPIAIPNGSKILLSLQKDDDTQENRYQLGLKCGNIMGASAVITGESFQCGPIWSTRMYPGPEMMQFEIAITEILSAAETIRLESEDVLRLEGSAGSAIFLRNVGDSLSGSYVLEVFMLRGESIHWPKDRNVPLTIKEDQDSKNNQCRLYVTVANNMWTEAVMQGSGATTGPVMMTRMRCPPELQSLETNMYRILRRMETIHLEGSMLEITGGPRMARFRKVPQSRTLMKAVDDFGHLRGSK